jgi:hypothetical protein
MKFIKTSGAKDKISRYKITDPYLISFIYKYENYVDWNMIKNKDDLNSYITNKLITDLYSKIDKNSSNNNYIKDVDLNKELEINVDQRYVQKARELVKLDENLAKEEIIKVINENKHFLFFKWWKYITKQYHNSPAFQYILLKPIIDSSPEDVKNGPLGLNDQAVSQIYEEVYKNKQVNIGRSYRKALAKIDVDELNKEQKDFSEGWIRIPSLKNDRENFIENVQRLKNLSIPRGWCTGQNMANPYLSRGDFWLYIENGEARVAIRFIGDNIEEIQGHQNQRPYSYFDKIEQLIESKGFDKQSEHYKQLYESKKYNDRFLQDIKSAEDGLISIEIVHNDIAYDIISELEEQARKVLPSIHNISNLIAQKWGKLSQKIRDIDSVKENFKEFTENKILSSLSGQPGSSSFWGSKIPYEIFSILNSEIHEKIFNVITSNFSESFIKIVNENCGNLFNLRDYAQRYAEEFAIRNSSIRDLWKASLLDYKIILKLPKVFIDKVRETKSYEIAVLLNSSNIHSQNPEEIIEDFYDYFWEDFHNKDQDELDELMLNNDVGEDEEDSTLYGEGLVYYISENIVYFWKDYVNQDIGTRFDEFERNYDNERYGDDAYELYDDYQGYWQNIIQEQPDRYDEVPEQIYERIFDFYDFEEGRWYIEAWVNYLKVNFDNFSSADRALEDIFYGHDPVEELYEELYGSLFEDEDFLRERISEKPEVLLEENFIERLLGFSNFIENNQKFLKEELINSAISGSFNWSNVVSVFEEIADRSDINIMDDLDNESLNLLNEGERSERLESVKNDPIRYTRLPKKYKDDPEFIEAWISNEDKWVELLKKHGYQYISRLIPDEAKEYPKFKYELEKSFLIEKFNTIDIDFLSNFDRIFSNYKDDQEFYSLCQRKAYLNYQTYASTIIVKELNTELIKSIFGKIADIGSNNISILGIDIARRFLYRDPVGTTKGNEFDFFDPILIPYILDEFREDLEDTYSRYEGYREEYLPRYFFRECYNLELAYNKDQSNFQKYYDLFKQKIISTFKLDAFKEGNLPNLFKNDQDIQAKFKEIINRDSSVSKMDDLDPFFQDLLKQEHTIEKSNLLDINRPIKTKKGVGRLIDYDDQRGAGLSLILKVQMPDGSIDEYVYEGEAISDVSLKPVSGIEIQEQSTQPNETDETDEEEVTAKNWYKTYKIAKMNRK